MAYWDGLLVQLVMIEYSISSGHGRDPGHDRCHGFRGPVEGRRGLIPVTNARSALGLEGLSRGKISETQAGAWDDAAPRLHLMHPCAVDRRARADEAWMCAPTSGRLLDHEVC